MGKNIKILYQNHRKKRVFLIWIEGIVIGFIGGVVTMALICGFLAC